MIKKSLTYKDSGVDIDAANQLIRKIKPLVRKTERPEVLSTIGHYAGLFAIERDRYRHPVLVASTDGVGTKLKLALEWQDISGLGQDLVAMSANDLLCMGAEPLFFLDYFATGKLDVKQASEVIGGVAKACQEIHCTLLGGETAEMPTVYRGKDFDLAGFIVGIVEKEDMIDGSRIKAGDKIIGIPSSGLHSNGFSLVRNIVAKKRLSPTKKYAPLKKPLRELLLEPTRLYVNLVMGLKKRFSLHGIAHITGGGLWENLPRIIPEGCRSVLYKNSWPTPPLFQNMQTWGHVSEMEMQRVFNCGIGLMLVISAEEAEGLMSHLEDIKEEAWIIGEILESRHGEPDIDIV